MHASGPADLVPLVNLGHIDFGAVTSILIRSSTVDMVYGWAHLKANSMS